MSIYTYLMRQELKDAATQEPGVLPRGERFRSVVSVADFCPSISDYDAHLTCSERKLQVH